MARFEMHEAGMAIMGGASMDEALMEAGAASAGILFQMGLDCAAGRAGTADLVSAHKWFNLAAMKGNTEAARYRKEISGEMTAADIATAQRLAREWLRLQ
ncbi:Uncharacterised protein [Pannonibacter phragmitetus]|uniref:Sel1 repeat n=1 Tax=Pannonibacter phragmitetus TaxID=121719 RepID=A0A378ZWD8_9HYPH|nr:Uncharacterised protein [Pannonibacter phragmitetus]